MSSPPLPSARTFKQSSARSSPPRNSAAQTLPPQRAGSSSPARIAVSRESAPPRQTVQQEDTQTPRFASRGPASMRESPRSRRQSPASTNEASDDWRQDVGSGADFDLFNEVAELEHGLMFSLSPENVDRVKATLEAYERYLQLLERQEKEYVASREYSPYYERQEDGRTIPAFDSRGVELAPSQAERKQRDRRWRDNIDTKVKRSHLQMALKNAGNQRRFAEEMQSFWKTMQKLDDYTITSSKGRFSGLKQKGLNAARSWTGRG